MPEFLRTRPYPSQRGCFCCLVHLKHSSQEQSLSHCRCRPSFPQIPAAWSAGVTGSLLTSVYGASQPRGKPLGVKLQVESIQEAAYSSTSSCQRTLNKLGGGKVSKPILCAIYVVCEINTQNLVSSNSLIWVLKADKNYRLFFFFLSNSLHEFLLGKKLVNTLLRIKEKSM